jgi:hypothetical protein
VVTAAAAADAATSTTEAPRIQTIRPLIAHKNTVTERRRPPGRAAFDEERNDALRRGVDL